MTFFLNVTDTGMKCNNPNPCSLTDAPDRVLVRDRAVHQLFLYHISLVGVVSWHLRCWRISHG